MKIFASILMISLLAGCVGITKTVEIPPDRQADAERFQLPITAGPEESVVYVVNEKPDEPFAWDQGLIFSTQLEIGNHDPLVTIPGEYAAASIKPGVYPVSASRVCIKSDRSTKTPQPGTVVKVHEPGWETYHNVYGLNMTADDRNFDFKPGKTYVFSILANCALVVKAGGVIFYPRIRLTDEVGGKYLVMSNAHTQQR